MKKLAICVHSYPHPDDLVQPIVTKFSMVGRINKIVKCTDFGVDRSVVVVRPGGVVKKLFRIESLNRDMTYNNLPGSTVQAVMYAAV